MRLIRFYAGFFRRFLRFYFSAVTVYDLHAPFVASFAHFVITDRRQFYAFPVIENLRRSLLRNPYPIRITDFGAGSKVNPAQWRSIKDIARHSAVGHRTGRWLFKSVLHFNPSNVLELGTSLGISALYLRMAKKTAPFITLEGCPETAAEAGLNFEKAGCADIRVITGPFSWTLPQVLEEFPQLDLLYMDGDHRAGASLGYFEACLKKAGPKSVFIIADIHWSEEMETAWTTMRQHPAVRASVDLFWLGFLFFDERILQAQHVNLVPWLAKPWRSGIFS